MTSSKRLIFKDLCNSGATRSDGRLARQAAQQALEEVAVVVLDFRDLRVTPSFADELVGRLAAELGAETFRARVRAENLNDTTRVLLRHAVRRRLSEAISA